MENDKLKWRFDVSTFRLIGRDLITDRITALFELVKNCYDANATRVDVIFEDISLEKGVANSPESILRVNSNSKIIIKDDGFGMSFKDVRDKWMVIGTASKRKNPYTPEPFSRRCVGEKGIGRFAVDKLGDKVNILTRKSEEEQWLNVEINWDSYYQHASEIINDKSTSTLDNANKEDIDSQKDIILFTDIENSYNYLSDNSDMRKSGTSIIISNIREFWTEDDIKRFTKEANKIVSPYVSLDPPFKIYVTAKEYNFDNWEIKKDQMDFSTVSAKITFNKALNEQETLYFDREKNEITTRKIKIKKFGGISFEIFYFDESARRKHYREYGKEHNIIDGVKIYRDGIIATPFAETTADQNKKRDILGIDKRLWQDVFNKVSTREIIGILDITKDENPNIIDATNRQDFIDNEEYRELKEFILEQLDVFEAYKIFRREKRKKSAADELKDAKNDIDTFASEVNKVAESNPVLKKELLPLIEKAKQTSKSVKKAIKEQKEAEKEYTRKENMYLSIMSLQEYAIHIAHAVRTSLGKIQRKAEYFYEYFPDPNEEELFIKYSKDIYDEMIVLDKVINFMLSYSRSNLSFKAINIKGLISDLFSRYETVFDEENIHATIDVVDNIEIYSNEQFFLDILQNIIANSIKALKGIPNKTIKCTGYIDNDSLIITFSDNGLGIPEDKRDWVFGIFNTTTAETGGAGIGLYVVKTRVESLNGEVEIINSEFGETGTTIKITLPFKK